MRLSLAMNNLSTKGKEREMGDKGGKKGKAKEQKQSAAKHDQQVKKAKDKQPQKKQ
nr:hypothetical protein [Desulfobulbaceae bacterium]